MRAAAQSLLLSRVAIHPWQVSPQKRGFERPCQLGEPGCTGKPEQGTLSLSGHPTSGHRDSGSASLKGKSRGPMGVHETTLP